MPTGRNKYMRLPCYPLITHGKIQERSTDDKHADRTAKQHEQQQIDMLNSKKYVSVCRYTPPKKLITGLLSVYLIATAVANRTKTKFYGEDLPTLEDVSRVTSHIR